MQPGTPAADPLPGAGPTTDGSTTVGAGHRGAPGVRWVARATVWCTVPSCLWRVVAGFGVNVGFTGELGRAYQGPAFLVYVWVLTALSQAAALAAFALVHPWGEVVPRAVPRLGGRVVPIAAVAVPAGLAGLVMTAVTAAVAFVPGGPLAHPDFPGGTARVVMLACYAPLLAWGPLVLVLVVAYVRRRRAGARVEAAHSRPRAGDGAKDAGDAPARDAADAPGP